MIMVLEKMGGVYENRKCKQMFTNSSRGYSSFANGATAITVVGNNYVLNDGKIAMGIDWMTSRKELSEAIPPAYTEFIGRRILEEIASSQAPRNDIKEVISA
jgi:hypothetical protein